MDDLYTQMRLPPHRTCSHKRVCRQMLIALTARHQALELARFLMRGMRSLQPHFGVLRASRWVSL